MRLVIFGAAGPTGLLLARQALDRGHLVTAVTRRPEEYPIHDSLLDIVRADATDTEAVTGIIEGADAVASVLGTSYSRRPIMVYSRSARAIVAAMSAHQAKRLVVTSSAAISPWIDPSWNWIERTVAHRILGTLGSTLYADMRRMEDIVRDSGLDWTIMRPLGLANMKAPTEYTIAEDHISGKQTARRDLAAAILDEIDNVESAHHRQVIAVATTNKNVNLPTTIWREGIRPQITPTLRRFRSLRGRRV